MKKYVNPPCNSSLATSCAKSLMASSRAEGKVAALFTEGVSISAEGELAIDETASTVSVAQMFVLYQECLWLREKARSVSKCLWIICVVRSHFILEGEADGNDSFVDIMSGITAVGEAESEGWTFEDALAYANLSVETFAEGIVDTSRLPTSESFFFIPH